MLDEIDIKILRNLQKDGRETASKIAEKLNLTVPTITERIKRLQESSVINGFQAIIDPKSVSLDVSAVITVISSSSSNYQKVIDNAVNCPEIIKCFSTTGMGSLLLWVSTKNSQSLEELLRKIQSWPDVTRTETQVILSSYKSLLELPI
tara:strand:- start:151 stop:597 length:447 start_codon:yes stop_codon:yes gene_type:complete